MYTRHEAGLWTCSARTSYIAACTQLAYTYTALYVQRSSAHKMAAPWLCSCSCMHVHAQYTAYTAYSIHSMYTAQHVHSIHSMYTAYTYAGCVGLGLVGNSLDLCRPSLWYFKLLHNFYIYTLFDKWPNESWLFHSCFPVIKSLKLH